MVIFDSTNVGNDEQITPIGKLWYFTADVNRLNIVNKMCIIRRLHDCRDVLMLTFELLNCAYHVRMRVVDRYLKTCKNEGARYYGSEFYGEIKGVVWIILLNNRLNHIVGLVKVVRKGEMIISSLAIKISKLCVKLIGELK